MVESHRSLQHDYEVSCEELDFLVDAALPSKASGLAHDRRRVRRLHRHHAAAGAAPRFREEIARAYQARYSVEPRITIAIPPMEPAK